MPAHGHDMSGLEGDLEGAIFLARGFGETRMTAQGVGEWLKVSADVLGSIRNAVVIERCDLCAVVVANENERPECARQAFLEVASNRFAPTGCDPDVSARFGEAGEFGGHFRVCGFGPAPGIDHRAVVVENDSGEASVAQVGEKIRKRIAPAVEFTQGGEVARGNARFPGDRGGLPRREARQPRNAPGAWEPQVVELAAELGHAGSSRVDLPGESGPSRDPQRREQRSERYGVRSAVEDDPSLGNARGDQVERALGEGAVRTGNESEHGARLTSLGEPVMPAVGEVAVVGDLKVAERGFRELRFEIDRANPR